MFQAPLNKVVVTVEHKYIGNITSILQRASIQNGASVDPVDLVNIVGKVISAPKKISNRREYIGYSAKDILPGDTVIFSHSVIFDFVTEKEKDKPVYRNLVWYKGIEYFTADITHIYAVIRDDKLRMQNDYVMLVEMQQPSKIILNPVTKRRISAYAATVSECRPDRDYWQGSTVYYNPNKLRLYQINGKPFGIIREKDILGVKKS